MKQLVIIPGGFHPFHQGHKSLYDSVQKAFPRADIYIAATSDTSTRPFPFALKKNLAQLAGVPKNRFVEVKSPFRPHEITENYDADNTVLIYARSEKDRDTSPQPGGIKKNGESAYLQPIHGMKEKDLQPMSVHGYMAYLPTVTFASDMTSSTEIRNNWPEYNKEQKSKLIQILYPTTADNENLEIKVIEMFDQVLGTGLSEEWSQKYKDSIDCNNPKGFSQKAHCQGKKKQNEDVHDEAPSAINLVDEIRPVLENAIKQFKNGNQDDLEQFLSQWDKMNAIIDGLRQTVNPSENNEVALDPDYVDEATTDNQVVQELFDRPGEIQKTVDDEYNVTYEGVVEGYPLKIKFKQIEKSAWTIDFLVDNRQDLRGDKSGKEIEIFSTVISAISQFVKEHNPEKIRFGAAKAEFGIDTSRAKLYDRLVRRFADRSGYNYRYGDVGDRALFYLDRKD